MADLTIEKGIDTVQATMLVENNDDDEPLHGGISSTDEASHVELKTASDPKVSKLFEYIDSIVECLVKLHPNLRDPSQSTLIPAMQHRTTQKLTLIWRQSCFPKQQRKYMRD
jgi:hypothetical protein